MKIRLFAALVFLLGSVSRASERPNIIFILADDMGWSDVGCQGHPLVRTPNLDRLAAEGSRFTQCYATGVTCCPSRTGFMTSRLPAEFAKYPAGSGFGERITVTELLKKNGYATGHFGKWHIGPVTDPGTYGIDVISAGDGGGAKKRSADSPRGRDAPIYDAAIRFIEEHREGPFYVNIWDHIPHHPVNPSAAVREAFGPLEVDESKLPAELRVKFQRCRDLGGDPADHLLSWLSEIQAMDAEIGALLKRLDELGLRENTLVAFSSDQGPAPIREDLGREKAPRAGKPGSEIKPEAVTLRLNAMGSVGHFRGGKHEQLEGGVRIPWILRWPGHIPAGRVDETSVLSGADWLPTLCAITGVEIDADDFEGEDASAAWLGGEFFRERPLLWKTSNPNSDPAMREGKWKYHGSNRRRGTVALYDLSVDPGEASNLVDSFPEVAERMRLRLAEWTATLPESYDMGEERDE